jgi:hypothetical protein
MASFMSSLQNEGTPSPAAGAHRVKMLCTSTAFDKIRAPGPGWRLSIAREVVG